MCGRWWRPPRPRLVATPNDGEQPLKDDAPAAAATQRKVGEGQVNGWPQVQGAAAAGHGETMRRAAGGAAAHGGEVEDLRAELEEARAALSEARVELQTARDEASLWEERAWQQRRMTAEGNQNVRDFLYGEKGLIACGCPDLRCQCCGEFVAALRDFSDPSNCGGCGAERSSG